MSLSGFIGCESSRVTYDNCKIERRYPERLPSPKCHETAGHAEIAQKEQEVSLVVKTNTLVDPGTAVIPLETSECLPGVQGKEGDELVIILEDAVAAH